MLNNFANRDSNTDPQEKPITLFRFIWKYLRLQGWMFPVIFLLSLFWAFDSTLWPYLIRLIVDTFTIYDNDRAASWPILKWLLLYGVLLWVFVEIGYRSRGLLRAKAFPQLEADIRMAMFDHIQHHSPKYFNEKFSGSLVNKINDMTTQVILMMQIIMLFIPAIATSILSVLFFFQVNPLFAIILSLWIISHYIICFTFSLKCTNYSNLHGEVRSALIGKIVDSFTNNFAVNLFSRFRFEKDLIEIHQKDERIKNYQARFSVEWMFVALSINFLIGTLIMNGLMISFWLKGYITTGETIQIFNTSWNVIFILWFAGEMLPQFFQAIGLASQALSVMKDPKDVIDDPKATPLVVNNGEIIFENVTFHYGEKKLFSNKYVHIKAGEKVGLVGYSGAGKSTFVNLILRFFPVEQGRILIDGQNIANVTLESLRKQVTLIPQDPILFHRKLKDNICYGRIEASYQEMVEAAKFAHCDEFIKKNPEGYNALVGERGTKLSGGERQRIAIARAMLVSSPILILDEATSALDSVTENYIQESLEHLMQNRTTLVVAHRLSTLSKMDRILVFDQGTIIEQGSHNELISSGGRYAKMWQMQAGGFLPDDV